MGKHRSYFFVQWNFAIRKFSISLRPEFSITFYKDVPMKYIYAPGCALMIYNPRLADKLKAVAEAEFGKMDTLLTCCFDQPALDPDTCIVTPCSTCNNRYRTLYKDCTTQYLLETIARSTTFEFPDYGGVEMSIQDTCSGRTDDLYLSTIRTLLEKMNIRVVEAEKSGKKGKCCGQVFYGKLPLEKVENQMRLRAEEMPCRDVVVYCTSCIQGMALGGKRPRYILDLLFNEETSSHKDGIVSWNETLKDFRVHNR